MKTTWLCGQKECQVKSYSWNTSKLLCSVFSWCFPGTPGIGVKCEFWSTVWHGVYMCHQHPARTACLLALLRRRWKSWAWFSSSAGVIRMWVTQGYYPWLENACKSLWSLWKRRKTWGDFCMKSPAVDGHNAPWLGPCEQPSTHPSECASMLCVAPLLRAK